MNKHSKNILRICILLFTVLPTLLFAQTGTRGKESPESEYEITIYANVEDAIVYLNGYNYGEAPVRIEVNRGSHNLLVKAKGYADYNKTIYVSSDSTYRAELDPERSYRLIVRSNVDEANVYINDEWRGETPLTLNLGAGSYRLKVTEEGYDAYESKIELKNNSSIYATIRQAQVRVKFTFPAEIINKDVWNPWNQIYVYVDGTLVETEQFVYVKPGNRTIRIESGGLSFESIYRFHPGNSYIIRPLFSLSVSSE
jgi:hypothetical protein